MPQIIVDRARLLEVILNLIENAAKFSADTTGPRISISADFDGEQVVCSVHDNGSGIEPNFRKECLTYLKGLT
ncbi:MAG: ATP-binding protein [Gammaproteobacteria bacterium]|nr:ATP-binding protein [Gammaproteobacteria bacterium]